LRLGETSVKLRPVRPRYLIVDDSPEFLASSTRLLESQGVDVVGSATTSEEAERAVEKLLPDVVLVDIELGDEDGIELTRRLAAQVPSLRIVLISVHDRDELVELLADSAAAGFLPKRDLAAAAIENFFD
jgi:two-component system, NarL family, nitrate/nitrite response regulator NarL